MTVASAPPIDPAKVEQFAHQVIGDMGAAMSAVLIRIGDRLGLYRALADGSPVTSVELAEKTRLAERYVREWLHNQAAAGWVTYDPGPSTFVHDGDRKGQSRRVGVRPVQGDAIAIDGLR